MKNEHFLPLRHTWPISTHTTSGPLLNLEQLQFRGHHQQKCRILRTLLRRPRIESYKLSGGTRPIPPRACRGLNRTHRPAGIAARASPSTCSCREPGSSVYGPECGLLSGPACVLLNRAAWECPPSRGCVMGTRENESPLPVYDSKVEGR
ncbi:hypothetical protein CDL15_Pgr011140 [Punica granatum]|uniref:Uncharacterized protein n=1 Tax=Punica granatum TaxID=22663 RepID=A0A218XNS7_PUNGR|nr:hypothetical protein CDL15_Pgr011140 [Punica granatum]PKI42141.1 hypothetical protein CRG98_037457 [Punica granatum]